MSNKTSSLASLWSVLTCYAQTPILHLPVCLSGRMKFWGMGKINNKLLVPWCLYISPRRKGRTKPELIITQHAENFWYSWATNNNITPKSSDDKPQMGSECDYSMCDWDGQHPYPLTSAGENQAFMGLSWMPIRWSLNTITFIGWQRIHESWLLMPACQEDT